MINIDDCKKQDESENKKKCVTVLFSESQLNRINALVKRLGVYRAPLLREVIMAYVEKEENIFECQEKA